LAPEPLLGLAVADGAEVAVSVAVAVTVWVDGDPVGPAGVLGPTGVAVSDGDGESGVGVMVGCAVAVAVRLGRLLIALWTELLHPVASPPAARKVTRIQAARRMSLPPGRRNHDVSWRSGSGVG
jgi:hypothetical protein